eukprot:CAMPEP_0194036246 /NCGR_PEP_ID=MMETSP0009_2-20130614/8599_1 /TAXON_ID=210454 /ORGANISM="Grammatophora oceanica, Strain CCMP 410" /LENGTH=615 /DNA_ID=CAMNT_0038677911 /DNA_START=100 /DNA_END=1947 /DNA_ORIENTATION=-
MTTSRGHHSTYSTPANPLAGCAPLEMPSDEEMKLLVKRATQHALGLELERDLENMLESIKTEYPTSSTRNKDKSPELISKTNPKQASQKKREVALGKNLTTKAPISFKLSSFQVQKVGARKADGRDDSIDGRTAPMTDEDTSGEEGDKHLGKNARAAKILEKLDKQKKLKQKQEAKVEKLLKKLEKLGVDTTRVSRPEKREGPELSRSLGNRYVNPLDDESFDVKDAESESVKTYYSVKNPFEDDQSKSLGNEDRYALQQDEESIMSFAAKNLGDVAPTAVEKNVEKREEAPLEHSAAKEDDWAPQMSTALTVQTRSAPPSIEDRAIMLQEELEKEVERALGTCVNYNDMMCADEDDTNSIIVMQARSVLASTEASTTLKEAPVPTESTALVAQRREPASASSNLAAVEDSIIVFQENVESALPVASVAVAEIEENAIICQENFETEVEESMTECNALIATELFSDEGAAERKYSRSMSTRLPPVPERLQDPKAFAAQNKCTAFGLLMCEGYNDTESVRAATQEDSVPVPSEPRNVSAIPTVDDVALLKTLAPEQAASVLPQKTQVESTTALTAVKRGEKKSTYTELETAAIRVQEGVEKELEQTMTEFSFLCHA